MRYTAKVRSLKYRVFARKKLSNEVVAGRGAGVNLEIECSVKWKKQGSKIVFEPTDADVVFHSYYDSKSSTQYGEPGLKIELDAITNSEDVEDFEYRMGDEGEINITKKNKLYDEENINRELVLSGGWVRHNYSKGNSFGFAIELDSEYGIFIKGTATFLEAGEYAWQDLDSDSTDDDDN